MSENNVPTQHWLIEGRSIALVCIALFFFLSGITFLLCYNHYNETKGLFLKKDRSAARLLSIVLEEHIQTIMKTMESYTNRPLLLHAVRNKNVKKAKEHLINMVKNSPYSESFVITDKEGTLWTSYPEHPEVTGRNFAYREWYKGVSKDWRPYISDVTLRVVAEKDLAFIICVPFIDDKGDITGILLNTHRTGGLVKIMKRVLIDPGASVVITDRKGNIVFNSRFTNEKEITPYPFYFVKDVAVNSNKFSVEVEDPLTGGRKRYVSYEPAVNTDWSVFVGRDNHQIMMSGLRYYIQTGVIALMLFLLFLLLLVYSRKKLISQWLLDRIRANEELAKSEIRFSELFENMSSGVAVYRGIDDGEDFIIVGMNTAGLMISHVQKEDIVGRSVKDVFPGIIGLGLFEVFQRVWKTGNREHHESSLYKDDSHSYWVENYVYRLPSGEIVAIYNDITDRKKAEESLHESEVKFRTIFDSANDGFLITDPVTKKLVQGNAAICSMLGYTKEEIKNLTIHDMHPPDNFSHVVDEFERQVKRESILAEGQPILRKDGSVFYADISSTFTTIRGISYLVGIFRDITERKQAEEVLKESEKKYKELIDGMNETVQVIDFNGNLIDVNKTAIEVLGYSKEELLAIGLHGIDSSLKKEDIKALANAMPSDKLQIFETSHKTKDGRTFPVEVCSSLVTYKGKQVILSIARNITERKLAEEELKQTFEKLRKSLIGTIQALSSTVETRDPYTSGHQKRVSNLARAIAQEMGLSNDTIDNIRMAGIIHDIGKVSVPAEILSKPGKISDLEMSLIRIHPQSGYDILKDVELPYPIAEVVLQHHERMDGSGYPQGLKGNQILLEAKIIAVADVIEAIASHRPYRPAKGIDAALEEIERNKGILYDEKVVEVCLKLFREKEFEFESTES